MVQRFDTMDLDSWVRDHGCSAGVRVGHCPMLQGANGVVIQNILLFPYGSCLIVERRLKECYAFIISFVGTDSHFNETSLPSFQA
jgi:hypothetical protein